MADRRTTPGPDDVRVYLEAVPDERRRADAIAALDLIRDVTAVEPVMWTMWFAVGLAPRKAALTLYGLTYYGSHQELLDRLGPHTTGKGCLYVKRLDALDRDVLVELVGRSWAENSSA